MQKKSATKTIALAMVLVLVLGSVCFPLAVSARWSYLAATYNCLTLNSGGRLRCDGDTEVWNGNKAGVTVELQQNNGGWTTIKTWTATGWDFTSVSSDWYVVKGYQYRLKLTHTALNGSNVVLETFVNYSSTVNYY